jgi:Spy/CpxP family protein refolding chaperone
MKTTTKIVAGTIAAFSFVTAGAVFAHSGMGPGMGMGMGQGPGMGMHGRMQPGATAADAAARLEAVKAELKILPAQEAAWQAFAGVMQKQAAEREAMRAQMQGQMQAQGANAAAPVDRSAHFEAMSKFREEHMVARSAALKDLYAVLTPEQKLIADQQLSPMPGHRMAGRSPAR